MGDSYYLPIFFKIMFPEFVSLYKDENDNVHLYVFPGIDDNGKQIYKNIDLNRVGAEYKFTKNKDKSIDFIIMGNIKTIKCTMINIKTGKPKTFTFSI